LESGMKFHRHRRRVDAPQPEHRLSRLSDPEKRDVPFRSGMRQCQPNHVAIKTDRTIEIGDGDVGFPQALDWYDRHDVLPSLWRSHSLHHLAPTGQPRRAGFLRSLTLD